MKTRGVAAVVVAMVLIAGVWTGAQEPATPGSSATATVSAAERLARLRADLEILQLDYDAERAYLVDAIREHRMAEQLNAQGNPNLKMNVAAAVLGSGNAEALKAVNAGVAKGQTRTSAAQQFVIAQERKRLDASRAYLAHAKQEFARLGQALADKQTAYNEALKGTTASAVKVSVGSTVRGKTALLP